MQLGPGSRAGGPGLGLSLHHGIVPCQLRNRASARDSTAWWATTSWIPNQDKVVNLLGNWDAGVDPLRWQPFPTVFERAGAHTDVTTISLPQFGSSPMTQAALRGARFVAAGTPHARTAAAAEAMAGAEQLPHVLLRQRPGQGRAPLRLPVRPVGTPARGTRRHGARRLSHPPAGHHDPAHGGPRHARRPGVAASSTTPPSRRSSPACGTRRGSRAWSTCTWSPTPESSTVTR